MEIKILLENITNDILAELYQVAIWGYLDRLIQSIKSNEIDSLYNSLIKLDRKYLAKCVKDIFEQLTKDDLPLLIRLARLMNYYKRYDIYITEDRFIQLIEKIKG